MNKYYTLKDKANDLGTLREAGHAKGLSCGLHSLDPFFSLLKGFPVFLAGAPHAGKTEFLFEILINTSKKYGWKHFMYPGEGGDATDVFAELCSKWVGKPYLKGSNCMTESERTYAEQMINEHFVLCDTDEDLTIDEFYVRVALAERELNVKFDTTSFDPWNDVKEELQLFGNREDKFLAYALKKVRTSSQRNKRIDFLVNHIADVTPLIDKGTGMRYNPPAFPSEWAGGRTWHRRAFQMLMIYRPPTFLTDINGIPYASNEAHVYIQKSKPKGVGKLGTVPIWYDWKKNSYYYKDELSNELFAWQTKDQR
jgi:hypothetical protein